ncbi:MAG: ATP-grasp domain-containing protein [Thermomicrobiales bacterium]|nr:ATP-grasp domain-containing protein [Thermomicrobiales bacterium]
MGDSPDSELQGSESTPGIRVMRTRFFHGPNAWSNEPVAEFLLDASDLGPSSGGHLVTLMRRSGFGGLGEVSPVNRLWRDAGTLAEGIALELQSLAGDQVTFSSSRPGGEPGFYEVVLGFRRADVVAECMALAVWLVNQALTSNRDEGDVDSELDGRMLSLMGRRSALFVEDAIFRIARERQIPIRWASTDAKLIELGTGVHIRRYRSTILSHSSYLGFSTAEDKAASIELMKGVGIPVPRGVVVRDVGEALAAAEAIGYPVVVKPVDSLKGRGVAVDLDTPKKLRDFVPRAMHYSKSKAVLIEEFVRGSDYRVLVIDDRVVAVVERQPAQVVGDARHTVADLIDIENRNPLRGRDGSLPMNRIVADESTDEALARVGLTRSSVPEQGQVVRVKLAGNVSQGGSAVDRLADIHPDNARLAILAARTIDVAMCGVDLVMPDISQSIREVGGAVLEVNFQPAPRVHVDDPATMDYGTVASAIVGSLYPPGAPVRVPVVAVLGSYVALEIAEFMRSSFERSGLVTGAATTARTCVGEDVRPHADLERRPQHQMVLRNRFVEMAVLQVTHEGFREDGLGFHHCDLVVLPESIQTAGSGLRSPEEVALSLLGLDGAVVVNVDTIVDGQSWVGPDRRIVGYSTDATSPRLAAWLNAGQVGFTICEERVVIISDGVAAPGAGFIDDPGAPAEARLAAACAVWVMGEQGRR